MENAKAIGLLSLVERKVRETVAEAIALLSDEPDGVGHDLAVASPDTAPSDIATGVSWSQKNREKDVSQRWPDGNVDTYGEYVTYRCSRDPFDGVRLALGWVSTPGKEGEVVGFVLGAGGGSKRPLTVFFPARDFDTTGERLSMIRGKDGTRKGFAPHEQLPPTYDAFTIEVLGDRIPGKWNVKAVVATSDELGTQAMLNHTAIQARLRGLI